MKEGSEEYKAKLEDVLELTRAACKRLQSIYESECAIESASARDVKSPKQLWLEASQNLCAALLKDL